MLYLHEVPMPESPELPLMSRCFDSKLLNSVSRALETKSSDSALVGISTAILRGIPDCPSLVTCTALLCWLFANNGVIELVLDELPALGSDGITSESCSSDSFATGANRVIKNLLA